MLGHVVVGGKRFPIEKLALRNGAMEATFLIRGPHRGLTGPVTVFGEDGIGCWQGRPFRIPPVPRHAVYQVNYAMRLYEVRDAGSDEVTDVRVEQ
jgi:hypothetical protein